MFRTAEAQNEEVEIGEDPSARDALWETHQRDCPFDNIRRITPEGGSGPRYKRM